jgi:hypothetical protein
MSVRLRNFEIRLVDHMEKESTLNDFAIGDFLIAIKYILSTFVTKLVQFSTPLYFRAVIPTFSENLLRFR